MSDQELSWLRSHGLISAQQELRLRATLRDNPSSNAFSRGVQAGFLSAEQAQQSRRAFRAAAAARASPPPRLDSTRSGSARSRRHEPRARRATGQLAAGLRLGPFTIIELIASGGMGAVYRGRHADGRLVALKTLRLDTAETPGLSARLEREVTVLSQLDHPHIVRLVSHFDHLGMRVLALELLEGSSLQSLIDEPGPARWGSAAARRRLTQLRDVADALAYCHARGLVHRDVKPSNIVIEEQTERAVLVDFGLIRRNARASDDSGIHAISATLSKTGELLGTPGFMSPEQIDPRSYAAVDGGADVWAFGATLFYCLSGALPYPQSSLAEQAAAILNGHPERLRRVAPEAPRKLERLCDHCLCPDPQRRPSMAAVAAELAALAGAEAPRTAIPSAALVALALSALTGLYIWSDTAPAAPPGLELSGLPEAGVTRASSLRLAGRASAVTGGDLTLDGRSLELAADGSFALTKGLDDGPNILDFVLRDAAGDVALRRRVSLTLDRAAPELELRELPSVVHVTRLPLRGRCHEPGATLTIQGGEPIRPEPSGDFTGAVELSIGTNEVVLLARDPAGNVTRLSRTIERLPLFEPDLERPLLEQLTELESASWIRLPAGRFVTPLTLSGRWVFEGAGADQTTLVSTDGATIRVKQGRVELHRLTVRGEAASTETMRASSCLIEAGALTAREVTFECPGGNGVSVAAGGTFKATSCRFRAIANVGAQVRDKGVARLDSSRFEGGRIGLGAVGSARVEASRCRFEEQGFAALYLGEAASAKLSGCAIQRSREFGVYATKAKLELRDTDVDGSAASGVLCEPGCELEIADLRVSRSGRSGLCATGARGRVLRLTSVANKLTGLLSNGSKLTVEALEANDNAVAGLAASKDSRIELRGGTLRANRFALLAQDTARLECQDLLLDASKESALLAEGSAVVRLLRCSIRSTAGPGLSAHGDSRISAIACEFEDNAGGPMRERGGQVERADR